MMIKSTILSFTAGLVFVAAASASPVFFLLGDHPDGTEYVAGDPDTAYGLRMDSLGTTYSAGDNGTTAPLGGFGGPLYLTYDPMDLTQNARIFGLIDDNSQAGDGINYLVEYAITGLSAFGDGFRATGGSGTLTQQDCGLCAILNITGKQGMTGDADGFAFVWANDGHRLSGDNSTWVGRGWLEGENTNDWLVTGIPTDPPPGEEVPEPATVSLMLLGLGALVARRKFGTKA